LLLCVDDAQRVRGLEVGYRDISIRGQSGAVYENDPEDETESALGSILNK
jgi:hypothetical protein